MQALRDKQLLYDPYILGSPYQCASIIGIFGLEMNREERRAWKKCTGLDYVPGHPLQEASLIIGRRGGKSWVASRIAAFLATLAGFEKFAKPGERPVVYVTSVDMPSTRIVFGYIHAAIAESPMLSRLIIEPVTKFELHLRNGIDVICRPSTSKSGRGWPICGAIIDEYGHLKHEGSSDPDTEILNAVRPAMATYPGSKLIKITTPGLVQRGEWWEDYQRRDQVA